MAVVRGAADAAPLAAVPAAAAPMMPATVIVISRTRAPFYPRRVPVTLCASTPFRTPSG